jgi:hypothetical protein
VYYKAEVQHTLEKTLGGTFDGDVWHAGLDAKCSSLAAVAKHASKRLVKLVPIPFKTATTELESLFKKAIFVRQKFDVAKKMKLKLPCSPKSSKPRPPASKLFSLGCL